MSGANQRRARPTPPRQAPKRRGAALLAAVVVFGAAGWWLVSRGSAGAGGAAPAVRPTLAAPAPRPAPERRRGAGEVLRDEHGNVVAERIPDPAGERPFTVKSSPEETARAIAEYEHANRYPPTSQPLEAHHTDLMNPNQRYEQELPSLYDSDIRYLYSGTRNTVLAGEARIEAANVKVPLSYTKQGDRYVHTLSPADLGVRVASIVETEIWFEATPGQEESRSIRFFYTPTDAIPARFTGQFRDVIEDGSLVIYAGIDVRRAGHYVIDVNLYGAAGEPVMYSRHKDPLPEGRSEVRFVFFGKALRDVGVPPPYTIGQLRGGRFVLGQDPDVESMPLEDWRYTTQTRFTLDDLSDAVWDSEHKRNIIRMLEERGTKPGRDRPGD